MALGLPYLVGQRRREGVLRRRPMHGTATAVMDETQMETAGPRFPRGQLLAGALGFLGP